jgi:hypothetical protein
MHRAVICEIPAKIRRRFREDSENIQVRFRADQEDSAKIQGSLGKDSGNIQEDLEKIQGKFKRTFKCMTHSYVLSTTSHAPASAHKSAAFCSTALGVCNHMHYIYYINESSVWLKICAQLIKKPK